MLPGGVRYAQTTGYRLKSFQDRLDGGVHGEVSKIKRFSMVSNAM
jgi:hypothetical protein